MITNIRMAGLRVLLGTLGALGSLISKLARSQDSKDRLLSEFRRRLNSQSYESASRTTSPFEGSGLAYWETKFDNRSISDIANAMALRRNEWVSAKASDIPAGALVLDAGAGECQYRSLFSHVIYKSQDFAQYQGTTDGPQSERWNYGQIDYVCDITAIPVGDSTFDVVLCTEVLEHVPDPIATVRELARVTKPGGCLLLSAPLGAGLHQEPYHFYGGFTPHFYEKFLGDLGFSAIEITPLGGLFQHLAQEIYRAGRVIESLSEPDSMDRTLIDPLINLLPRMLSSLDGKYPVNEFTVGYLVHAKKKLGDISLSK